MRQALLASFTSLGMAILSASPRAVYDAVGVAGLYLYAFSAVLSVAGTNVGAGLMLLMLLVQPRRAWVDLSRHPFFLVSVVFAAYAAARAGWAMLEMPQTTDRQLDQLWEWVRLSFVWLPGWWLAQDSRRIYAVLLLMLAGFLTRIAYFMPWADLETILAGDYQPLKLGLWHIRIGLYAGVALLGTIVLGQRLRGGPGWASSWAQAARSILWLLLVLLLVEVVLVAKSRTAWIAVLAVVPVVTVIYLWPWLRAIALRAQYRILAGGALVLGLLAVVVGFNLDGIQDRAGKEEAVYEQLLHGDLEDIPETSVGLRVQAYRYALQRIAERPLFGWGTGTTRYLLDESGIKDTVGHFHNSYLEVLVRLGLLGAVLFAAGLWILARGVWRAYRDGALPRDLFWFLTGALGVFLIWNLADYRLTEVDNMAFLHLLTGIAYVYLAPPGARSGQAGVASGR